MNKYTDIFSLIKKDYKIVSMFEETNSTYGVCYKATEQYFYKISSSESINLEISGNLLSKNIFITPTIVKIYEVHNTKAIVMKYVREISYNKGLLCDELNDTSSLINFKRHFQYIFDSYEVALNSKTVIDYSISTAYKKFILNRLTSRWLNRYIQNNYFSSTVILDNKKYDLKIISENVTKTIEKYKKGFSIISHGDPNDMNFGINKRVFDMETFGITPISLEFASFYLNLLIGGNYLFPKYQHNKYLQHDLIYSIPLPFKVDYVINNDEIVVNSFTWNFNKKRRYMLDKLMEIFEHFVDLNEVKYLIIFRLTTIINIRLMSSEDQNLVMIIICWIIEELSTVHESVKKKE